MSRRGEVPFPSFSLCMFQGRREGPILCSKECSPHVVHVLQMLWYARILDCGSDCGLMSPRRESQVPGSPSGHEYGNSLDFMSCVLDMLHQLAAAAILPGIRLCLDGTGPEKPLVAGIAGRSKYFIFGGSLMSWSLCVPRV
jgi:hypothetical protein